ncbi:hypothetical protein IEE94_15780 [Yimella sp. cx-573]|nr:hypothetical protein [Yimella sp. cx-573]
MGGSARKQRETSTDAAGLTLMGVRYYNWVTGAFTSPDPIPGGNDTSYGYPSDPINHTDVSGEGSSWRDSAGSGGLQYAGMGYGIYSRKKVGTPFFGGVGYVKGSATFSGIYSIPGRGNYRGYVGQSRNVMRRLAHWEKSGRFTRSQLDAAVAYRVRGTRRDREIAEQRLIDWRGGNRGRLSTESAQSNRHTEEVLDEAERLVQLK